MRIKTFKNKKDFTPIKLEITIEDENELLELWHRLNVNWNNIVKHTSDGVPLPYKITELRIFWNIINKYIDGDGYNEL